MMDRIVARGRVADAGAGPAARGTRRAAEHARRTSRTSICGVACRAAREAGATLIAAFTLSGTTARLLSHYRPPVPIVAFSPNQEVRRRLALLWGVVPRVLEPIQETEAMVRRVEEELLVARPGAARATGS